MNYEQTIRGATTNFRGVWRTPFRVSTSSTLNLEGGYLNKNFEDPAEQDITDGNVKGVLTFKLFTP